MPEANPNRVASFMKTKREGMLVGTVFPDQMERLIEVIKEAKTANKGIVFFLWSNRPGSKFVAGLTVAVARDREEANATSNKPIGGGGGSAAKPDPLAGLFG